MRGLGIDTMGFGLPCFIVNALIANKNRSSAVKLLSKKDRYVVSIGTALPKFFIEKQPSEAGPAGSDSTSATGPLYCTY